MVSGFSSSSALQLICLVTLEPTWVEKLFSQLTTTAAEKHYVEKMFGCG